MRIKKILLIFFILFFSFFPAVQSGWAGSTEFLVGGARISSISSDGRFVVYNQFVGYEGDIGVFVRDRQTGQTVHIGSAYYFIGAVISADGRIVVWANDWTIFVHDLSTGQESRIIDSEGDEIACDYTGFSISENGRFLAFSTDFSNVFVHDRQTGETTRVAGGNEASISGDGRFVSFASEADNLVPGDTNGLSDVFVHDRRTGETTRVSVNSDGEQANSESGNNTISLNGRFVAFVSDADNIVPGDTNGFDDVFVHDRQTGQTTRISVSSNGEQANESSGWFGPTISADGRFVAFLSHADNLVLDDTNARQDVFVHDRQTGKTTRVSVDPNGEQMEYGAFIGSISANGRFVAFNEDYNSCNDEFCLGMEDLFVHDRYGAGYASIIDNTDPQFSKIGYWKTSDKAAGFYGTDYRYAYAGDGSGIATFAFEIPVDGNYEISAQWPAHISRATDAPYTLINNGDRVDTVLANQQINGGQFNPLSGALASDTGTYQLSEGMLEVALSNDADGKVAADAVKLVRMPDPIVPVDEIVDNTDPQFSKIGYWKTSDKAAGFYGTDYRYAYAGDGSAIATFTFEIPVDGNYEISAQWPAHISRATDAPYSLINNGEMIDTVLVDQRINGGQFNPLIGPAAAGTGTYALSAGVLEVTLSDDASGKVAADAVHLLSK